MSVLQAHKHLGLFPGRINKEQIQQAYRSAAKRYHPDSTAADSAPCAVRFRQCSDAKDVLLKYYLGGGRRTAVPSPRGDVMYQWKEKSYHPLQWLQNSKTRQFAMGMKALVLFLAACDGVLERRRKKASVV